MPKAETSRFNTHLLEARLKRVPQHDLERFLNQVKYHGAKGLSRKSRKEVIGEIVDYYNTMKSNDDFSKQFSDFIRDYVLGARESEYLIYM
jgi:hypothetical protein